MKSICIKLTDEQLNFLRDHSAETGLSMASLIRLFLSDVIKAYKSNKQELIKEAIEDMEDSNKPPTSANIIKEAREYGII